MFGEFTFDIWLIVGSLPNPIRSLLFESMNDPPLIRLLPALCISSSLISSLPKASNVSDELGGLGIVIRDGLVFGDGLFREGDCWCCCCCTWCCCCDCCCCLGMSEAGRCGASLIRDALINILPSNGGTTIASSTASIQTVIFPTFFKNRKWYLPGTGKSWTRKCPSECFGIGIEF